MTTRVIPIRQWVTAADVKAALRCSRARAYQHLAAAGAVKFGPRTLRLEAQLWEPYLARIQ